MESIKVFIFFLVALLSTNNLSAKNAQRIIALSPHAVEMLYAIGAGDRIVGTVEYADYPEAALKIPRIGNYAGLQIERVVELQPDLIVGWKGGNRLTDLEKIKSLGLNLIYSSPQNINEVSMDIIKLGEQTGLQKNALLVSDELLLKQNQIKKYYQQKNKVKVFYQLWHDPLRTIGADNWINSLIEDCNGQNLFNESDSQYPIVSLESVLTKDPRVIIIPHHSGNVGAKKEIWNNWTMVNAVKNNRLFTINGDLLHRPTPRAIEGLEKICEAIDTAR